MTNIWIENLELALTTTEYIDYKEALKSGAIFSLSSNYCEPGEQCDIYIDIKPYIIRDHNNEKIKIRKECFLSNIPVIDCIDKPGDEPIRDEIHKFIGGMR